MVDNIFSNSFDEWFIGDSELVQNESEFNIDLAAEEFDCLESESDLIAVWECEETSDLINTGSEVYNEFDIETINESKSIFEQELTYTHSEYFSENIDENLVIDEQKLVEELEIFSDLYALQSRDYEPVEKNIENKPIQKSSKKADQQINSLVSNTINTNIEKVINAIGDGIAQSVETAVSRSIDTASSNLFSPRDPKDNYKSSEKVPSPKVKELVKEPREDKTSIPLMLHQNQALDVCKYPNVSESVEAINATKPKSPSTLLLENSHDLTEWINPWLHQSLKLAELSQLGSIVDELQSLKNRWLLPGFQLAVVGEINRGKSTLINRLLKRFVVNVDELSSTATFTSVTAGSVNRMEVRFSPKRREARSVEESSWKDLLTVDSTGNDREVFADVQISLDDAWLRSLDIKLIDTPGTGDLNGHRASLICDLLNRSDAVVMVVSAIAPLSMTEATFLKELVMGRHIDCILVVVSHLDEIAKEQRTRLLDHIQGRVAEVSETIPVLPLHPVNDETEAFVMDAVKNQIATMVSKGDRRAWRSQQVARQLADHLCNLIKIGENAIASARIDPVAREQALQKAQAEAQQAEVHWQKIRHELDNRSQQCYLQLQEKILNAKDDLIKVLCSELNLTPNPKLWWERKLPSRVRLEFPILSRKSENFLLKAIARDFEWLQSEVSRAFDIQINWKYAQPLDSVSESLNIDHEPEELEIIDLQRYHLLARIGSSAAMIGGYVFGPPVGIITNLGVGLLSETFVNKTLDEQRRTIEEKLTVIVDEAFDKHCQHISESLHNLYRQLIEDTKRHQSIWESVKNTAIQENAIVGANETLWQQMIESASILKADIITVIQQHYKSA
ncbi:dynamin family protein [Nostoc sp. UHCC 0302]|uniref:dynamin family protein n=1 Tax=Nostoc sp. UHCC 0302 TaxID=3134896 RepID=UPI00311C93C5